MTPLRLYVQKELEYNIHVLYAGFEKTGGDSRAMDVKSFNVFQESSRIKSYKRSDGIVTGKTYIQI